MDDWRKEFGDPADWTDEQILGAVNDGEIDSERLRAWAGRDSLREPRDYILYSISDEDGADFFYEDVEFVRNQIKKRSEAYPLSMLLTKVTVPAENMVVDYQKLTKEGRLDEGEEATDCLFFGDLILDVVETWCGGRVI